MVRPVTRTEVRPKGVLLIVMLGFVSAIGPLSIDMYLPAFPAIADDLGVSAAQVQLSLTACLVGSALGGLVCGPLSDKWGRRRPAIAGLTAYAILSFLIAFSPSAPVLIGLRVLQGFAGGTGIVVARAIVRDLYSGVEAARFYSRLTLIYGLAPILAPSLGSAVLRFTSWHGIFVALGVLATLLTLLLAWRLPETLPVENRTEGGLGRTLRLAGPLFRDRSFVGYTVAQGFAFGALFTYLSNSSFVLQDGYGLSPTMFGLLFGLNAVGLTLTSQLNARLLNRFGTRPLLLAALAVQVVSGVVLVVSALAGALIGVVAGLFLLVCTIGMGQPNATALALDGHADRAGTAAAVMGSLQPAMAGALASLAGLGAIGTGVPMAVVILGAALAALVTVVGLTS
ncbi:Bcr/CflA family drug resistance efflux transporter [Paractinoplanes tereljensis]|uniref:Bcr/CflA family drug resistance efflux transporter n=1 Tax=Paractinoplanes tereljensis TaxID=571912 RepID=A0A919NF43_9ACTN|nr:Bcr/CflA family drug resistance efflux transporter [Actinoplanes tereljensis]